jgi:ribosomal protein S18 acetylase RimI-like enzyme
MAAAQPFRPATEVDLRRLERMLVGVGVFGDADALRRFWEVAPWRIQVTERGDLAVLERWRDHLGILATEALWCAEQHIDAAMRQLHALALRQGFEDLLSPPVSLEQKHAYESAGMHVVQDAYTLVLDGLKHRSGSALHVEGVTLKTATPAHIVALLELDIRCFDDFWRYDVRHFERYLRTQRLVVAESGSSVIGYTLSTVARAEGTLGRLAVIPEWRRRRVGTVLVEDALTYARERGADRVTLCTQADNDPALGLYRAAGFRETGRHFVFLQFGVPGR